MIPSKPSWLRYVSTRDYDKAADLFVSVKDEKLVENEQFQAMPQRYTRRSTRAARVILEQDHAEQADFTALYQYLISLSPLSR